MVDPATAPVLPEDIRQCVADLNRIDPSGVASARFIDHYNALCALAPEPVF